MPLQCRVSGLIPHGPLAFFVATLRQMAQLNQSISNQRKNDCSLEVCFKSYQCFLVGSYYYLAQLAHYCLNRRSIFLLLAKAKLAD